MTTAWLVERKDAHLCIGKICEGAALSWVAFTDSGAMRFPTKEAADAFIQHQGLSHIAVALSHEWV